MIEKSRYAYSFDLWDYADKCGADWSLIMTFAEIQEIQCKIDELSRTNFGIGECPPPDRYGGEMTHDLLARC